MRGMFTEQKDLSLKYGLRKSDFFLNVLDRRQTDIRSDNCNYRLATLLKDIHRYSSNAIAHKKIHSHFFQRQ